MALGALLLLLGVLGTPLAPGKSVWVSQEAVTSSGHGQTPERHLVLSFVRRPRVGSRRPTD